MHKYIYVCSVCCNGTAAKPASRFWGFYFLCSPNSLSLKCCTIFFIHSLVALKWPPWTSMGTFNQLIRLVSCPGKARCRSGWLLFPWQRAQTVGREMVLPQQEFVSSQRASQARWRHRLNSVHRDSVHHAAKTSGVTKGEYCRVCIFLRFTGISSLEVTAPIQRDTPKKKMYKVSRK